MKKISFILTALFSLSLIFTSCNKDEVEPESTSILPENFRVEIPAVLKSEASTLKGTKEIIQGNEVYEHLTTFINVGDEAAEIVSAIINSIGRHGLSQPMSFTYESGDDNRDKNVVIIENASFEGKTWQYQMNITDADSEGNEDKGIGIQVFWNKSPVEGIAILKPINIDRTENDPFSQAIFRIDYSETGANSYEQEMTVYIAGLQLEDPSLNPYSMSTLKMSVGKNGNTIEVFGNSNHPNATIFTEDTGFNWAFVAAGSDVTDMGVAEVALPPSNLNSTDRQVILKDYSVKQVFTNQINATWPGLTQTQIDYYLQNTEAPGYFNHSGFVQGGTSPGAEYDVFEAAIANLTPYNPIEVSNLTIAFKTE